MKERKKKGTAQPRDKEIGEKVRMIRQIKGLSQEKLGDYCNVSFQQIQKYERGVNRISAARLEEIAIALGVSIMEFYKKATEVERDLLNKDDVAFVSRYKTLGKNHKLVVRTVIGALHVE